MWCVLVVSALGRIPGACGTQSTGQALGSIKGPVSKKKVDGTWEMMTEVVLRPLQPQEHMGPMSVYVHTCIHIYMHTQLQ